MKIINFSHPLTGDHVTDVEQITGRQIDDVITVRVQIDTTRGIIPQVDALFVDVDIDWYDDDYIVRLPALDAACAGVCAKITSLAGRAPTILTLRRGSGPVAQFEVWEIVDLGML